MAYKEKELKKVYWTTGEAAKFISTHNHRVLPSTIRFWCEEFSKWLKPKRDERTNKRLFNESQMHTLLVIKNLLYHEKFQIEGAKRRLTLFTSIESNNLWQAKYSYSPGDVIVIDGRECRIKPLN